MDIHINKIRPESPIIYLYCKKIRITVTKLPLAISGVKQKLSTSTEFLNIVLVFFIFNNLKIS